MGNVVQSPGITARHSGNGSSAFPLRLPVPAQPRLPLSQLRPRPGEVPELSGLGAPDAAHTWGQSAGGGAQRVRGAAGGSFRARGARRAPRSPWAGGVSPVRSGCSVPAGLPAARPVNRPAPLPAAGGRGAFLTLTGESAGEPQRPGKFQVGHL
ncbi:hypothetical protein VULLAG_LOCUS9927 [Vulpes lagopus]